MKWNQIQKRIKSMLAESVMDRIAFGTTSYRRSHDQEGRGWIAIDGKEILNMPSINYRMEVYRRIRDQNTTYEEMSKKVHELNLFSQWDLQQSLFQYIHSSIDEILFSANPMIRAMGMLDARLGKKRLAKMDISIEHDLVKKLYHLRTSAEHIEVGDKTEHFPELSDRLEKKWKSDRRIDTVKSKKQTSKILSLANKSKKIKSLIHRLYHNEIPREELITEVSRTIYDGFKNAADPKQLFQTLKLMESKSKLLGFADYVRGVIALSRDYRDWIRPIEEWRMESHNPHRQFSSLARHLWAYYDVPVFMDYAWLKGNAVQQEWFKMIGAGKNIRNAKNLPVILTKQMAHSFLQAPDTYSIEDAFRWAQVRAIGGDRHLVDSLLESRIAHDFRDEDFWLSVFRFFTRNPMLDLTQIGPMIDYIWNQKYENRMVFGQPGVVEQLGPEQPNFSMKGRTVLSILKAVEAWHKRLGREPKGGNVLWQSSGIKPAEIIEGTEKTQDMKIWRIRELLSSNELIAEGRGLKHCVASYANSCQHGNSSIWTMEYENEDGIEKLVTIEITNGTKQIRQVRGKRNRLPTEKETEIIKRWASRESLEWVSYY